MFKPYLLEGTVNGKKMIFLRDSGATRSFLRSDLVESKDINIDKQVRICTPQNNPFMAKTAEASFSCADLNIIEEQKYEFVLLDFGLPADGIIGNDMGSNIPHMEDLFESKKLMSRTEKTSVIEQSELMNIDTDEQLETIARKQKKMSRTRRKRNRKIEHSMIGEDEDDYWNNIIEQNIPSRYNELNSELVDIDIEELFQIVETRQSKATREKLTEKAIHETNNPDVQKTVKTKMNNRDLEDFMMTQDQKLFKEAQKEDKHLRTFWLKAEKGEDNFMISKGLLYKSVMQQDKSTKRVLVVPSIFISKVLHYAHDNVLTGHQGMTRTLTRIKRNFFWPNMSRDAKFYIRSCSICQLTSRPKKKERAPLQSIPASTVPYEEIVIDFIGPLTKTRNGKRFVLMIVDSATRSLEAIPMRTMAAKNVAENLLIFFTRVGIPKVIRSDNGKSFTAKIIRVMEDKLGIAPRFSSIYHPQSQGVTERANDTIKRMMNKFMEEFNNQWDKFLPFLIFAHNDAENATLGFSPHQLVYGRTLRGFGEILKNTWTTDLDEENILKPGSLLQYYDTLRDRIQTCLKLAHDNAETKQVKYKKQYDKQSQHRTLEVNDLVLVTLPTTNCKLTAKQEGPYRIIKKVSDTNYVVMRNGKQSRFHINMLRKFNERHDEPWKPENLETLNTVIVTETNVMPNEEIIFPYQEHSQEEFTMNERLTEIQKATLKKLLNKFDSVFSDTPGRTHLAEHKIELTDNTPINLKSYRIPASLKAELDEHIDKLLKLGIIEESNSPYSFPIVICMKKNSNDRIRMAINFKRLNAITIKDVFPVLDVDEILQTVNGKKYISTIDLTKCFYQIPLREENKIKTAFRTHRALYRHTVLPFGLSTAPATCQRLVNNILNGIQNYAMAHLDDICICSESFDDHLRHIEEVLKRLLNSGLKANKSKCKFAMARLKLFGHIIEDGFLKPDPEKCKVVLEYPIPKTKKQLRSFLGLANFYRKFIEAFADISKALTDLTKKALPDRIKWSLNADIAFNTLKRKLSKEPVLMAPNFNKSFVLQTDASLYGISGILCQEDDTKKLHPISYASRILSPAETRYSFIERELLAIVWSLGHYSHLIFGQEVKIQTDHQPLRYLDSLTEKNARLTRWSLILQNYNISVVEYKRGTLNGNADALSRYDYDTQMNS